MIFLNYLNIFIKNIDEEEMDSTNELIDFYEKSTADFEKQLSERSFLEIKYDKIILDELDKGKDIKSALKVAAKIYPLEALDFNIENIDEIASYYDYLLNHEKIKKMSPL